MTDNRAANFLLEKLCTIEKQFQSLITAAESSAFVTHVLNTKSQSVAIKTTSSKPSGKVGHLKKKCRKLKVDKNKSVVTDSNGSLSVDDTRGSAFLAVSVNSMRLVDKWYVILVHCTVNKQYFVM